MTSSAVLRGADLLDEARPGWELERKVDGSYLIDLETLDMTSVSQCVVGQLWAPAASYAEAWWRGIDFLAEQAGEEMDGWGRPVDIDFPSKHGFDAVALDGIGYSELRDEWIELISDRRERLDD